MGASAPYFHKYYMSSDKLKILMCSEASFLSSGFGTYTKELLSRLHKTKKYDLAEFASYGFVNDHRDKNIPWKYYANAVRENDPRFQEYSARQDNQFGRWRFDKVLLDFRPDVVIDIRDYWMSAYQAFSPLRKYFHWILMPTVDSAPQQDDWIDTYLSADAIFTYSDWGGEVLKNQSHCKINYINTASPGVDLEIFKQRNVSDCRKILGIDEDALVIGSVMRNQKRKLIPELLKSFRNALDTLQERSEDDIAKKIFLYLHTSYPDMGWDIPELLNELRLSNKVLFTYTCRKCGNVKCSTFCGAQTVCQKCMTNACFLPSVTDGISQENLSRIYNTFDLYVQYSICEGFGMPQVEAGACGIPIATVDYSAMCDIIKKLKAFAIPPQTTFKELETKAYRVYPDGNILTQHMLNFLEQPKPIRKKLGAEVRSLTEKHYNWDDTAKRWEEYLDKLDSEGYRSNWDAPAQYIQHNNIDDKLSNIDNLFRYCTTHMHQIDKIGSYKLLNLLKESDYGFAFKGPMKVSPTNNKNIEEFFEVYAKSHNIAEKARVSNTTMNEDYILYAKMKGSS